MCLGNLQDYKNIGICVYQMYLISFAKINILQNMGHTIKKNNENKERKKK